VKYGSHCGKLNNGGEDRLSKIKSANEGKLLVLVNCKLYAYIRSKRTCKNNALLSTDRRVITSISDKKRKELRDVVFI